MKLLLDTHVFLWLQTAPRRLTTVLDVLARPDTELMLSAASGWEIAIKCGLGRLPLPEPPEPYVLSRIRDIGATTTPITLHDALAVADLPLHHRDPFDRILVVQTQRLGATLVTADEAFEAYDVPLLRVR